MSEAITCGFSKSELAERTSLGDQSDIAVCRSSVPSSTYLLQPLRSLRIAKSSSKPEKQLVLDDERRAPRHTVNLLAEVFVPEKFFGMEFMPCIIRDISKTGVCLEFNEAMLNVPDQLTLSIDDFQFTVECKPKWIDCRKLGLIFDCVAPLVPLEALGVTRRA